MGTASGFHCVCSRHDALLFNGQRTSETRAEDPKKLNGLGKALEEKRYDLGDSGRTINSRKIYRYDATGRGAAGKREKEREIYMKEEGEINVQEQSCED